MYVCMYVCMNATQMYIGICVCVSVCARDESFVVTEALPLKTMAQIMVCDDL